MIPAPAPWLPDAACATHPTPEAWTPRDARDPLIATATAVCATCPALERCRAWADQHQPTAGVWAGRFHGGWA